MVTLYHETLVPTEALKIEDPTRGGKTTDSDMLDEAIRDLAQKWSIKV